MKLKRKEYPTTQQSVEIIKEHGADYWLAQMEAIKQHNHKVIDNQGRVVFLSVIAITLFLAAIAGALL